MPASLRVLGVNIPGPGGMLRTGLLHCSTADEVDRLLEGLAELD
jgi:hypothetical protein